MAAALHLLPLREGVRHSTRHDVDMAAYWTRCNSSAVEAYRYRPADAVLQIIVRDGRQAYDYPCDEATYRAFLAASSMGRFVDRVLRPVLDRGAAVT
jgi:hypothetical protein